ncbi:expressed unknown protein [Seminavis robusta]|uniref:PDZ domain-containing protein n=1 Tax=Seminavis robusta TaxID=568900 RepID=A0A9N8E811_9STRA|nr:expressed unknown protein [Seminavis robusta]|eukprot:Sro649_g181220.1 n/a (907) ;mRNA; f:29382-32194
MDVGYGSGGTAVQSPSMQKWYEQQHHSGTEEIRSVTPAMNNTRGSFRNSPAASAGGGPSGSYGNNGSSTPTGAYDNGAPNRYLGAYNSPDGGGGNGSVGPTPGDAAPHQPSSTGLIRLSLRKPMGIVFEPMYDPNNASLQRGVRICDLPRTGAAALSRKLEVGDELLSINDKTMSRLSFDEIMDFIIEADPEEVNLLFRRPRKETLQARQGIKKPSNSQPAVKWVDDDVRNKKKDKKKDRKTEKKPSRRSKKEEDDTITSHDEDYRSGRSSRKKGKSRKHPYESESFLDLLIDTICANPDHACRERRRGGDDDYYSDEDEDGTFASQDDSTYVTYESEDHVKRRGKSSKKREDSSVDEETEEDTVEEKWKRRHKKEKERGGSNKSPMKDKQRSKSPEKPKVDDKYEDDGTLETVDSQDRAKAVLAEQPPLGLTPEPEPVAVDMMPPPPSDDDANPAPIKELEYDDRIDHGADVSVMESLGGPSLLIEKQRMAAAAKAPPAGIASGPTVPTEFIEKFGKDYPVTFGLTHEQTIQADPLKFYTSVVKGLLEEHEPEKVRLLDKLLAKYKGREDHLVQKLSVRYSKNSEPEPTPSIPEEEEPDEQPVFVEPDPPTPRERSPSPPVQPPPPSPPTMQPAEAPFTPDEWPDKETKEAEEGDSQEEQTASADSEYSGDSIDGTSPAVIAQVSELLNYVYGKTSVPGQIDRVSTIMRAYEGREAVLLELLETKALIKANKEKENADNLPSFLRNTQAMQFKNPEEVNSDMPPVTPMATQQHVGSGGTLINDDISSMSGVSSPAEGQQQPHGQILNPPMSHEEEVEVSQASHHELSHSLDHEVEPPQLHKSKNRVGGATPDKKKKKGIFGGLFGGKKNKKNKDAVGALPANDSLRSGSRSRASRKLRANSESSI